MKQRIFNNNYKGIASKKKNQRTYNTIINRIKKNLIKYIDRLINYKDKQNIKLNHLNHLRMIYKEMN